MRAKKLSINIVPLLLFFIPIFIISCGGDSSNNNSSFIGSDNDTLSGNIVSIQGFIYSDQPIKEANIEVYDKNGNLIDGKIIYDSQFTYKISEEEIKKYDILVFKVITEQNKEYYGVYSYTPINLNASLSKDTTTAYLISKYLNDVNFDSYFIFLSNLKEGKIELEGSKYPYKDIFLRFLPLVEDYYLGKANFPTTQDLLSIIPENEVQISQEEIDDITTDRITKLVKFEDEVLSITFNKVESDIKTEELKIKVLEKEKIEFLGESFYIYKIDVGDNVLKDFHFKKLDINTKEIQATSSNEIEFCDSDGISTIDAAKQAAWYEDGTLSRKVCKVINWDETGFDYKSQKFRLVLNYVTYSHTFVSPDSYLFVPSSCSKEDGNSQLNEGIIYTCNISTDSYFEFPFSYALDVYLSSASDGYSNIDVKNIYTFRLNSVNDQIRTKASNAILAYRTLKETRAKPIYDTPEDHWNNFVNSNEYKWSITTNEVITHRIIDFDEILGKGINTTWDQTDYAKNLDKYKNNDNRIPLILIHGWQGDKDLRNPAKLGLWKNSELQYFQHLLDYYLTNENLQNTYHIYLYHYTSYKHITYNAYILKDLLNEVKIKYPDSPLAKGLTDSSIGVVIIGHSMGGLIARALIEEHRGLGEQAEYLRKLITLDTPHHGSVIAENFNPNKLIKDLGTHGAFDLNWDNFDGAYDDNFINKNNGRNRWIGDASVQNFDTYYWEVSSEKRPTANPYLLYLNEIFKSNLNLYRDKYIFYVAWNVHSGITDTDIATGAGVLKKNLQIAFVSFIKEKFIGESEVIKTKNSFLEYNFIENAGMNFSTWAIGVNKINGSNREFSYSAGGAEPVGSAFLAKEGSEGGLFDPYGSNENITRELLNNFYILDNLINIYDFNIRYPHPYGIPYRLFWDYDHEKIVNGAYNCEKGCWDIFLIPNNGTENLTEDYTAFKTDLMRCKYIEKAYQILSENVNFTLNCEDNKLELSPLHTEPVFIVLYKDLSDIAKVTINSAPFINVFTIDKTTANEGDTITFSYDVSDPDGDVLTCEFDFDGDGNIDETINDCSKGTINYVYSEYGDYIAKINVSDSISNTESTIKLKITDSNMVIYIEDFSTNPNFTSLAPDYAYWDSENGNYYVKTKDDLEHKYWAYSPDFGGYIDVYKPFTVQVDILFENQDWGTYPCVRFYGKPPLEMKGSTNPTLLRIDNAYRNSYVKQIGIYDENGHEYYTPQIENNKWYRVTIEYKGNGKADIEVMDIENNSIIYAETDIAFQVKEPFRYLGVGYYDEPDYGDEFSPIRIDNVIIEGYKVNSIDEELIAYYEFENSSDNLVVNDSVVLVWENLDNVIIENGYIKLINEYDGDPKRFISLNFDTENISQLRIEKKTRLIPKDSYFLGSTTIMDSKGNEVYIVYNNYHYNNGDLAHTINVENTEHFYIFNRWNYIDANNFEYKISTLLNPVWNDWFYERIIIDYVLNKVEYSISMDEVHYETILLLDINLTTDKNTKLTFSSWDWASGSEHLIDYIKIFKQ